MIVQRTLAAKNVTHGKGGCLLAGTLKFLPLFLLVIPGMAARVLFKNKVGFLILNYVLWYFDHHP